MNILDIDVDFFQDKIIRNPEYELENIADINLWELSEIEIFLTNRCNIIKSKNISFFKEHFEVYYQIETIHRNITNKRNLIITHIDAHSDLGYEKELNTTYYHNSIKSSNFLFFVLKNYQVIKMNIVFPEYSTLDIPEYLLGQFYKLSNKRISKIKQRNIYLNIYDKIIPVDLYTKNTFNNKTIYDYVFITQSPKFTSKKSEDLIKSLRKLYSFKC